MVTPKEMRRSNPYLDRGTWHRRWELPHGTPPGADSLGWLQISSDTGASLPAVAAVYSSAGWLIRV